MPKFSDCYQNNTFQWPSTHEILYSILGDLQPSTPPSHMLPFLNWGIDIMAICHKNFRVSIKIYYFTRLRIPIFPMNLLRELTWRNGVQPTGVNMWFRPSPNACFSCLLSGCGNHSSNKLLSNISLSYIFSFKMISAKYSISPDLNVYNWSRLQGNTGDTVTFADVKSSSKTDDQLVKFNASVDRN